MTPISFTLTGAHGIRAGLGRDSLSMDLDEIPDEALTVAIRGDNGLGKSTILNLAMTPWREPPQVAGTMYDQFGETGLRELIWEHAGIKYRTRIEYRNTGKTKTQRAYLHQYNGVYDWQPVELPDHTVSNGLSSTYDACLSHILGPQEIYYLSAFRAQGAPKLADHDDPKGLMRALLNLDEPAELAEKAKDVTRELKRALDVVRDQASAVHDHPDRIVALEFDAARCAAEIPQSMEHKSSAQNAAALARAELDRAMSGDLDRQRVLEQRAAVQARLNGARNAAATAIRQAQQAHAAAVSRATTTKQDLQLAIAALERDLLDASARAARAQDTLGQRDTILAAEAEASRITAELAEQEQTVESLAKQVQSLRDLAGQIRTLEVQRDHAAADGQTSATRLADLTARAGFVAMVPCQGHGIYAECPALKEAKAAEGQIPAARTAVESRRAEWKDISGRLSALAEQVTDLGRIADNHQAATKILATLRTRLEQERKVAAQASALELAEKNLAEAQAAVVDLTARLALANLDRSVRLTELDGEIAAAAAARDEVSATVSATVSAIEAELAGIPELGTDQAVTIARQRLADAEAAVQAAQASIDQASATKAQHEAEIARLRSELEANAAVVAKARRLESEIADWTLLAMGLRGVIDLSIEDAGPSIAAIANDLLNTAYGPRFSVRIVTQREQANGKTVETFDISVIDAESGMEASILQKSGGEAVILDRCLTDAAAIFQQDQIGRRYETAFADEADGALSGDNRRMFYQMERRAMEIGRYGRKYFVSHRPDSWDDADYVLDLARYRSSGAANYF